MPLSRTFLVLTQINLSSFVSHFNRPGILPNARCAISLSPETKSARESFLIARSFVERGSIKDKKEEYKEAAQHLIGHTAFQECFRDGCLFFLDACTMMHYVYSMRGPILRVVFSLLKRCFLIIRTYKRPFY